MEAIIEKQKAIDILEDGLKTLREEQRMLASEYLASLGFSEGVKFSSSNHWDGVLKLSMFRHRVEKRYDGTVEILIIGWPLRKDGHRKIGVHPKAVSLKDAILLEETK